MDCYVTKTLEQNFAAHFVAGGSIRLNPEKYTSFDYQVAVESVSQNVNKAGRIHLPALLCAFTRISQKNFTSLPSIAEIRLLAAEEAPIRNRSGVHHSLPRISSTIV